MKRPGDPLDTLALMVRDLARLNNETGNAAAYTLCAIQDDLYRIIDGLVWGG